MKTLLFKGVKPLLLTFTLLAASALPAAAQCSPEHPCAPDLRGVVVALAAQCPAEFHAADREGSPIRDRFVRAAAWALHQHDPRFGLNMKRDDDRQGFSLDVITFRVGPTDRHVEAYDIVGAAGTASPQPQWLNITDYGPTWGTPGTARWVQPEPASCGGAPPPPGGDTTPPPDDAVAAVLARLVAIEAKLDALRPLVEQAAAESYNAAVRALALEHIQASNAFISEMLQNPPAPPEYTGKVLGFTVVLRPRK